MYGSAQRWMIGTLMTIVVSQAALIVAVLRAIHP